MSERIYLEIRDAESLVDFLKEAQKRTGLLKDISPGKLRKALSTKAFPIRIPIDLDGVIDIASNPVLKKMFGRKVEDATKRYLIAALETC